MSKLKILLIKYPFLSYLLISIFIRFSFFESVSYCEGWPIYWFQPDQEETLSSGQDLPIINKENVNAILEWKSVNEREEKERILRENIEKLRNTVRLEGDTKYIKLDLLIKNSKFSHIDVDLQNLIRNVKTLNLQISYNENCQVNDPRSSLLIKEIEKCNLKLSDVTIREQFNYLIGQTKNPVLVQLYTAYMHVSIRELEKGMPLNELAQHYRLDQIFIRKTYIKNS